MTKQDAIDGNPLLTVCQDRYGMQFKKNGGEFYSSCPFHTDGKRPNFRVNIDKKVWYCDVCGQDGGTVVELVMKKEGKSYEEAMESLAKWSGPVDRVEVAWYDYTDENGKLLYQVVRFQPKDFRQRRKGEDGKWIWNLQGVRRVLYQLPKVLKAERVFVCEGEKDCDSLMKIGMLATTNVCGATHWLDAYSDSLKGRDVVIWPDRDKKGEEHYESVVKSLGGKAKRIFRFDVDDKDASDYIARVGDGALAEIEAKLKALQPINLEGQVPVMSIEEMEADYMQLVKKYRQRTLDLALFIPTLGRYLRPIVPGELVTFLADTGQGKTALLQNLAMAIKIPTLIFELELPSSALFERFVQIQEGIGGREVFSSYDRGEPVDWRTRCKSGHIFVCAESRLNAAEMERIILLSELKIGVKPSVVMVDYVGLMHGKGQSRYERMSDIAEQLKVVAKKTDVIMIICSQLSREDRKKPRKGVGLHDAKDSGSIENSSQLVIGCWREDDGQTLALRVLKSTKGGSGATIRCNFHGETLKITEQVEI